jgi:hypothetical protein
VRRVRFVRKLIEQEISSKERSIRLYVGSVRRCDAGVCLLSGGGGADSREDCQEESSRKAHWTTSNSAIGSCSEANQLFPEKQIKSHTEIFWGLAWAFCGLFGESKLSGANCKSFAEIVDGDIQQRLRGVYFRRLQVFFVVFAKAGRQR